MIECTLKGGFFKDEPEIKTITSPDPLSLWVHENEIKNMQAAEKN